MKKHTPVIIMLLTVAAMFAVSCSKEEEPKYSEEKLIGSWKIPLYVEYPGVSGKTLSIYPDHTAMLHDVPFNAWKIEGDVLTLTNDINHGYNNHELGVMKVKILNMTDSTMTLVGNYTHALNSTVDSKSDVSGLYNRLK